jgi:hypothetical protein
MKKFKNRSSHLSHKQGSELNGQKVVKNGEKNLKKVNKRNFTEN